MKASVPLICLAALAANASIVDRVAITVSNKVITESSIDLRIRLTAFENGNLPETSLATRRKTADLLIDQRIVERLSEFPGGRRNRCHHLALCQN